MCLGVPGKVVGITDAAGLLAHVEVSGIKREVNLGCVVNGATDELVGKWVLVHVGFAMCVIDEAQAKETLAALESMQALEHELDDFSQRSHLDAGNVDASEGGA
ncbi:HypC/HybG/HupF family hydrogenase formation chaperone [Reinekea marinisedimentorum]|uniref:Hydrogenase expression/formation protein HypC n=1 Tax=Reinekea marinisedimentorum TaxID=230495 RepID=A0A4R3HX58_9GAMM|nr:HypC/HybG/HupF family hydrogenase formation chaperone [Reinekea marinisedimentorum]TCS36755.1 hydrogenase expression/formation protein HypC [Reinekea marinisedimentorum]